MTDLAAIKAELRTLLAAATPPPWAAFIDNYGDDTWPGSMFITADPRESQAPLCDDLTQADAALIVAAVNALPALLADTPSVEPAGMAWDAAVMALEAGDELAGAIAEYLNPANQFTESRLHAVREALSRYARLSDAVPEEAGLRPSVEPAGLREAMEVVLNHLNRAAQDVHYDEGHQPTGWQGCSTERCREVRDDMAQARALLEVADPAARLRSALDEHDRLAALLPTQASDSPEKP